MIRLGEKLDVFSDSVGIYILPYLVYWALLHLAKGILLVFFLLIRHALWIDDFQIAHTFLVFSFFMEFFPPGYQFL